MLAGFTGKLSSNFNFRYNLIQRLKWVSLGLTRSLFVLVSARLESYVVTPRLPPYLELNGKGGISYWLL